MHGGTCRHRTCPRHRQEQKGGGKRRRAQCLDPVENIRVKIMIPSFLKKSKALIGVIHLKPLPGAPRWNSSLKSIIAFALADARAYERGGAHALFVENFGDVPFTKGPVAPETLAAMTAVGSAIREAVSLPLGF